VLQYIGILNFTVYIFDLRGVRHYSLPTRMYKQLEHVDGTADVVLCLPESQSSAKGSKFSSSTLELLFSTMLSDLAMGAQPQPS